MLVVRVELHSSNSGKVEEIGRAEIFNVAGKVGDKRGNYGVRVFRKGSKTDVLREGSVNSYPRKSYNMWRLIIRALKSAFPEET